MTLDFIVLDYIGSAPIRDITHPTKKEGAPVNDQEKENLSTEGPPDETKQLNEASEIEKVPAETEPVVETSSVETPAVEPTLSETTTTTEPEQPPPSQEPSCSTEPTNF